MTAVQFGLFEPRPPALPPPPPPVADLPTSIEEQKSATPPPPAWSSKSDLLRRGWTLEAIAAHLGEPDRKAARRGSWGVEAHLYAGRRVEAAEATEAWRTWRAGIEVKRAARADARARAAAELVARMERWNPGLRAAPLEEVRELAIEHYNGRRIDRMLRDAERGHDDHDVGAPAALDSDPDFLARTAVNFIRHRMTRYDAALRACGTNEAAVAVVRRRVYEAIATAYPDLAEEARRQHERRGGAR